MLHVFRNKLSEIGQLVFIKLREQSWYQLFLLYVLTPTDMTRP